jgi:hypothetical protein
MSEDDFEDAGPRQIPWKKILVVILVIIVGLAAYVEVTRTVTSGEPFPAMVTVSGRATIPQPATTAAIANNVYFQFPNGTYDSTGITISNNNYLYSITVPNRVNYTILIAYHELVGSSSNCVAGSLNLQSHTDNATYDANCPPGSTN